MDVRRAINARRLCVRDAERSRRITRRRGSWPDGVVTILSSRPRGLTGFIVFTRIMRIYMRVYLYGGIHFEYNTKRVFFRVSRVGTSDGFVVFDSVTLR